MSNFQIFSPAEIEQLKIGGDILRRCLEETGKKVRPGMTTLELDRFAESFITDHEGAKPAFKGYRGFPGTLCTSVNEECVHGIPGDRILQEGDIVSLDGGVIYGGLYTDSCITVGVGEIEPKTKHFLMVTSDALEAACKVVRPGARIGDISAKVQKIVEGNGFSCVNGLTGHGLGTRLHQFPDIPNSGTAGTGPVLPAWTLIAIEPITAVGKAGIVDLGDGWTISTEDGSLSAHFEHTILVTEEGMEIVA